MAAGGRIAVLSPSGVALVSYASTCEENRRIKHGERILRMHLNPAGTLLVTYGYITTKVWNVSIGRCVATAPNPISRPRPHSIDFTEDDRRILLGFDDRRLRMLNMTEPTESWQMIAHIEEQPLEGTVVNSPSCMALSPDGHNIALRYRGYPSTVWEIEGPKLVGRCLRVFDDSTKTNAAHAWGEVTRLSWHPYTGEVIGLYLEGAVFRWHPYHDETQEVHAGANSFTVSRDAECLATGDPNVSIKLFDMADFNLVYQIASQDPVLDLCFAPDSRHLYDVRGSHSNVWEPNSLLRLSESTETSDDSVSVKITGSQLTTLKLMPGKIDPVAALAPQPTGRVYFSGTESGVIELFDANRGDKVEPRRSKDIMGIQHIVWSNDGKLFAFADLCKRLFVKSVMPNPGAGIESVLEIAMNFTEEAIRQVLFHPDSIRLMIYSPSTVTIVSLVAKSILATRSLDEPRGVYKWIKHPSDQNSLLAFGPSTVHVWSWYGLVETATLIFDSPSTIKESSMPRSRMSSSIYLPAFEERVERVLKTVDESFVLVQCSRPIGQGRKQQDTLLFDVATIPFATIFEPSCPSEREPPQSPEGLAKSHGIDSIESPKSPRASVGDLEQLECIPLPPELVSRIEVPLNFLSRDRLVFPRSQPLAVLMASATTIQDHNSPV